MSLKYILRFTVPNLLRFPRLLHWSVLIAIVKYLRLHGYTEVYYAEVYLVCEF